MEPRWIRVRGAREHTLKNVAVDIPRDRLTVMTGLSGSGKSSLAFDTIYAEGKRRYVESLSSYARQMFEQLEKPDLDYIEGLPPTIAIEQKQVSTNPRSTVATITEIHDYLRLLFARLGRARCPGCDAPLAVRGQDELVEQLLEVPHSRRFLLLAPLGEASDDDLYERLERIRKEGFVRARIDGEVHSLGDLSEIAPRPAKGKGKGRGKGKRKRGAGRRHSLELVVDRLQAKPGMRQRIAESLETALQRGSGIAIASVETPVVSTDGRLERRFVDTPLSDRFACAACRTLFPDLTPRLFSFNSPEGACPACDGLGTHPELDEELIVPDADLAIADGAIEAWRRGGKKIASSYERILRDLAERLEIPLKAPYRNLSAEIRRILMHGTTPEDVERYGHFFEGVIPHLKTKYEKTESSQVKSRIHAYMSDLPCPACGGSRLRDEALAVEVGPAEGRYWNIASVLELTVEEAYEWCQALELSGDAAQIGPRILAGITERLRFMNEVGVGYLTLARPAATLSGGETQRIRLAAQVGSGLAGICYVLDEPTIGLHQRDNARLLQTLFRLRDAGNTVIVVEHDEQTIRNADHLIDMGPGAGVHGGEVVAEGTLAEVTASQRSLTAAYLKHELEVSRERKRKTFSNFVEVKGARANNLQGIDVRFPLGGLICVTGVSGSGKSTLVREVLYKGLARKIHRATGKPGPHERIVGTSWIDRVVEVDQSPIGRSPRSNPATFSGVFNALRRLFASLKEARIRGYDQSRFSFNVKGGRCEACQGQGQKRIEMHFLPDMSIRCEQCGGSRYKRDVLEVRYRGLSIADVLDLTVESARRLFSSFPRIRGPLKTIEDVGLGYLKLGQSSTTLSGGEAQRLKLAAELSRKGTGHTLYILDEPTTGLHFADISRLMEVLDRLARGGSTLIVIEHNLDVIACADWIIDLGPEGGTGGGSVVCEGPPAEVATCEASHTGGFLRERFRTRDVA